VRFHSIGGWGAITTGKNLGAILGDLNDTLFERDGLVDELGNPKEIIHVSANPKYGSEKKGAPTSYFMVAAKDRIRVNCDLRHVNVVLCCDPKAFTHCNPLDGMAEGGSLVWESEETGEQAWERLPQWARKQIVDNKIRVFTLPGFKIARNATDRAICNCACRAMRFSEHSLRFRRCWKSSASRRRSIAMSSSSNTSRSSASSAMRLCNRTWKS
jgi:pyruvate-ferredoxin/flavodoxin oxidoreductase